MNRRVVCGIVLASLIGLGLAACGSESSTGSTSSGSDDAVVRVAMQPLEDWLPIWVMDEQGFAKDQGFSVKEITSVGGTAGNTLVATGEADVGYGAPLLDLLLVPAGLVPKKMVVLPDATHIGTTENPESALVGSKEINSWKDLEGKTIATHNPASLFFIAARYLMEQAGVDYKSVKVVQVPIPEMEASLKAGRIDAFVSGMDVAYKTEQDGVGHKVAPVVGAPELDDFAVDFTIVNAGFYSKQQDLVRKFLVAEMEAVKWIVDNPEEAKALRNERLGYNTDDAMGEVPLLTWVPGHYFDDVNQIELATQMLMDQGLLKEKIDPETIMTGEDLLKEARRSAGLPEERP